jgi:hypothetical protein
VPRARSLGRRRPLNREVARIGVRADLAHARTAVRLQRGEGRRWWRVLVPPRGLSPVEMPRLAAGAPRRGPPGPGASKWCASSSRWRTRASAWRAPAQFITSLGMEVVREVAVRNIKPRCAANAVGRLPYLHAAGGGPSGCCLVWPLLMGFAWTGPGGASARIIAYDLDRVLLERRVRRLKPPTRSPALTTERAPSAPERRDPPTTGAAKDRGIIQLHRSLGSPFDRPRRD